MAMVCFSAIFAREPPHDPTLDKFRETGYCILIILVVYER